MRHISKLHPMGCAIATAAMLGNMTYEEAEAGSRGLEPARTRWPRELQALLGNLTGLRWRKVSVWAFPLRVFDIPEWPIALFIQDSWWHASFGQWIVAKEGLIHDPGLPIAYSLKRYPRRDWLVAEMIEPASPAEIQGLAIRSTSRFILNQLATEILGSAAGPCDKRPETSSANSKVF